MDARTAVVAPLAAPLRVPARAGLGIASLFFWLLALGSVVGMGLGGVKPLAFLWLAGLGLMLVRKGRQSLA